MDKLKFEHEVMNRMSDLVNRYIDSYREHNESIDVIASEISNILDSLVLAGMLEATTANDLYIDLQFGLIEVEQDRVHYEIEDIFNDNAKNAMF